jgi:hypothetical protein
MNRKTINSSMSPAGFSWFFILRLLSQLTPVVLLLRLLRYLLALYVASRPE